MALPDYGQSSTASFSRNQVQRQRKKDKRQERRADNRASNAASTYTSAPQSYIGTPASSGGGQLPESTSAVQPNQQETFSGATSPGFQGSWTPPRSTVNHPFYDPQSNYTQPGQQYANIAGTPLGATAKDASPAGTYYGWASNAGYGGLDAKSQAVQGMYGDFTKGYEAARLNNNFELRFEDFMNQQNVPGLLEQMTSQQLGMDNRQFDNRDRWQWRG